MSRRLVALALLLAATVVACASTSRSPRYHDFVAEQPALETVDAPTATRYELDALRVADGTTYQGTLELRGTRALLVVDVATWPSNERTERRYAGTVHRGDLVQLTFTGSGEAVGALECVDDGHSLTCVSRGAERIFDGRVPAARFERLALRASTW